MITDKSGKEYTVIPLSEFDDFGEVARFVSSVRATSPHLLRDKPVKANEEKKFIDDYRKSAEKGESVIIIALDGNRIVAWASLDSKGGRMRHVTTLGVMLEDSYRGKGLGQAIIREILKHRTPLMGKIKLSVASDNKVAIHVYTKTGFKEVARFKDWVRNDDGTYCDDVVMELEE